MEAQLQQSKMAY